MEKKVRIIPVSVSRSLTLCPNKQAGRNAKYKDMSAQNRYLHIHTHTHMHIPSYLFICSFVPACLPAYLPYLPLPLDSRFALYINLHAAYIQQAALKHIPSLSSLPSFLSSHSLLLISTPL